MQQQINALPPCGVAEISNTTHPWSILRLDPYLILPQPRKGVAIYFVPTLLRGEEVRFAHLIPSLWCRNPQGGSMIWEDRGFEKFRSTEVQKYGHMKRPRIWEVQKSCHLTEPPWGFREHSEGMSEWATANEAIPLEPRNMTRTIIRYPLGGCGNIK